MQIFLAFNVKFNLYYQFKKIKIFIDKFRKMDIPKKSEFVRIVF